MRIDKNIFTKENYETTLEMTFGITWRIKGKVIILEIIHYFETQTDVIHKGTEVHSNIEKF